jgi:uncharacterized protein YecE (DUF72 family)
MDFIIGCSGFHYKHWKGNFYPEKMPSTKWLQFYTTHFNTLELNVSFYRFPTPAMLQGWYDNTPPGFIFSVKAPRSITHFKKFLGTERMISDFYNLAGEGLKEKLGCVLFQLPPNFVYTPERLRRITQQLDLGYTNVLEFRHQSWWLPAVYKELAKKNIAFCGMSHPDFPAEVIGNTKVLYYRMHGDTQLYASDYSEAQLDDLYHTILGMQHLKQAFVYFNNDIHGFAVKNAAYLKVKNP